MNPYKLKDVYNYLTSNNQLLKRKLKLGTSEIPIPPKKDSITTIEAINRFNKANPRVDTTNLKPLSVKQSNVKQSNVDQSDEGVIQGAFDTATREAQSEGLPAPKYEAFKKRYLRKNMKADGGRIGYKDGPKMFDVQASGSKSGKQQIENAPEGITSDKETINAILTMDIPLTEKVNLIGNLKYGKFRDRIEYKDDEIFLEDPKSYRDRNIGLDYNRGGEGFSGSATVGDEGPEFNIRYKKSFADGGMLVQSSDDGSRPGYKEDKKSSVGQPKQYDLEKIEEAILKANQGDKYVSYEDLGKKLNLESPGRISGIVRREGVTPLDSYKVKVEKAYIKLFSDFDKNAMELTKPLHRIKEMIGGYKYRKNANPNRSRVEDISNALKSSKVLNWDEEVKPIINKLSSANFLKNIDKDWTLGDVQNTVQTKSMLRTPKDDAQRLMDYAVRNQTMSKGNTEFSIYNKNNLNKRITDFSQVDSYYDLAFKDGSGKVYDMDYIKTKGRSDPLFQEYFKLQDDLSDMKNRTTWPDGSDIIDPKTGKKTTFGNYSGQMYKFGYGYKKPFSRFPYEIDHNDGVGKNPFKNLSILPQRVNIALGAASRLDKPEIASKIGKDYFRNLPIDDLLMREKNLGEKILIFNEKGEHVGKNLKPSYTAAKGEINRKIDQKISGKFTKPISNQAGFVSKELLEDVARKIGSVGRKGIGLAGSIGVLPEVLFYQLDKNNMISKGMSETEAEEQAKENVTLGLYENKAYMDSLKEIAEDMDINPSTFDSAYNLNILSKQYEQNTKNVQDQVDTALQNNDQKTADNLIKNYRVYKDRTQKEYEKLENDITGRISGGSPQIMSDAKNFITEKQFAEPFYDMQNAAIEKLKREKLRAFDTQKLQSDTAAGSVGSTLLSNVFNTQSLPKAGKFLFDLSNPFSALPNYKNYLSDAEKENQMLRSLEPSDLNLVNLARGFTRDNIRSANIESPILASDIENIKYQNPGVFFSKGGIASLTKTIPPASGPTPHGLPSLTKRGIKIKE